MRRVEYKADSFRCTFASRRKFDELLQEMLDKYSAEGWLLHSYHLAEGDFCTLVFYREVQN